MSYGSSIKFVFMTAGKIFTGISFLLVLFTGISVFQSCMSGKSQNSVSYTDVFKSGRYTREDIALFNDIAFTNGRIHKWTTDIKVQVIGEACPNCPDIDIIINDIAPLIAPLKIMKVKKNGNVIIHRGVDDNKFNGFRGYATIKSLPSKGIKSAVIYETKTAKYSTLMHEFEHVLGLNHPRKVYPYDLLIWGESSPKCPEKKYHFESDTPENPEPGHYYFKTWDDYNKFQEKQKTQMLTEQEKCILRMLYSPTLKPGLKRIDFMQNMGIKDNISIWEITKQGDISIH